MRRIVLVAAAFIVLIGAPLIHAQVWEEKTFMTWSDEELNLILNDSPWSRPVSISVAFTPVDSDAGDGDAGDGDAGDSGPAEEDFQDYPLTITWRTALPMKQALIRTQLGRGADVPPEAIGMLARPEEAYAISVAGLPAAFEATFPNAGAQTFLMRTGKEPIVADEILSAPQPDGTLLMLAVFPRLAMVALEDEAIEFVTTLGPVEIRRLFPLKEMVFHGQLEL